MFVENQGLPESFYVVYKRIRGFFLPAVMASSPDPNSTIEQKERKK